MRTEVSWKEDLGYLAILIFVSVFIAFLLMFPFVDFLSRHVKFEPKPAKQESVPVQMLPEPVNYNIPCDDTDCFNEMPLQEI